MFQERKKTDFELLRALTDYDGLDDKERSAFGSMLSSVKGGQDLSTAQRKWVESAFKKYELDADEAQNLVSSGQVPRGREVKFPFESMPRPLKPPGRT